MKYLKIRKKVKINKINKLIYLFNIYLFKMDFRLILLLSYLSLICTQLTKNEISYIKNYILSNQNQQTGIFFEEKKNPLKHTRQSIESLLILEEQIPNKELICKTISNNNEVNYDIIKINLDLNCKNDFSSKFNPNKTTNSIEELYYDFKSAELLNHKSLNELYKISKEFLSNNKFSKFKNEKRKKSIFATSLGIEIFSIAYGKLSDEKNEIKDNLKEIINSLQSAQTELSDNIVLFSERDISIYKLNNHVLKAIKLSKKISSIKNFNDYLFKTLNYFKTFKYEFVNCIESVYYLLDIYKNLEKIPLMSLEKDILNYIKEKNIKLNFINVFGKEIKIKNTTITYELIEDKEKNEKSEKKNTKKSSYDLDDDIEEKSNEKKVEKKKKEVSLLSNIDLDFSDMIQLPGYYKLNLEMNNQQFDLKEEENLTIQIFNEVKIDYLEILLEDRITNNKKEEEIKINYPSRTGRNFKATQDDIIRIKIKLNFPDNKLMKIEQLFLRLKHNDLKKSFDSYSYFYNEKNDLYYITFELDDPVKIESYNGKYSLYIYLSDRSIEKPIIWNFGDMEIKYIKPQNINEAEPSYFNIQKNKMEPTFNEETSLDKNKFFGILFSTIIICFCFLLFGILNYNNFVNLQNFPKEKIGSLFNLLFVCFVVSIAYVLVLFWVKLNILQTFGIFVIMFIPGVTIVYQAMKNLKVDI